VLVKHGWRAFEVGLIGVVNNCNPVAIEFTHEVKCEARDAFLKVLGLGIDNDLDTAFFVVASSSMASSICCGGNSPALKAAAMEGPAPIILRRI